MCVFLYAESTNVYLNVNAYSSNHTVYVIPVQPQTENTTYTYKVLYQLGETHDDCGGSQDMPQENNTLTCTSMHDAGTALLFQLPTPPQANFVLCFMLTIYFADFTTIVIKGNLDFNSPNTNNDVMPSITASSIPPKHKSIESDAEANTTLIAATTLCAIIIILTILVIISLLVIVALRRRRKWRNGPSNQDNNIYE